MLLIVHGLCFILQLGSHFKLHCCLHSTSRFGCRSICDISCAAQLVLHVYIFCYQHYIASTSEISVYIYYFHFLFRLFAFVYLLICIHFSITRHKLTKTRTRCCYSPRTVASAGDNDAQCDTGPLLVIAQLALPSVRVSRTNSFEHFFSFLAFTHPIT